MPHIPDSYPVVTHCCLCAQGRFGLPLIKHELAKIFPSVIARMLRTQRSDWVRVCPHPRPIWLTRSSLAPPPPPPSKTYCAGPEQGAIFFFASSHHSPRASLAPSHSRFRSDWVRVCPSMYYTEFKRSSSA